MTLCAEYIDECLLFSIKEDEEKWLDCSANPFAKVQSLIRPFPCELMAAHEVSQRIYDDGYDAPDCAAPLERQPSLFL